MRRSRLDWTWGCLSVVQLALAGCATTQPAAPIHPPLPPPPYRLPAVSRSAVAPASTAIDEDTYRQSLAIPVSIAEESGSEPIPVVPNPEPLIPTPEPATEFALSLWDILHLADAQNPNVGLARERINEAYARVARAESLWLPSVRGGLNYNHHEGVIQDVAGNVFKTDRSSFYGGFGANAVGAGSPAVPGLIAQFHLSDAIFQPRIAEHHAASREFGAAAARNDVLRDAAIAYLELVRAEHGQAIADEVLRNTQQLLKITQAYADSGQGLLADYQRMAAEAAIREAEQVSQLEAVQVASARLAQILHADPALPIASDEPTVTPLDMLAPDEPTAMYVALGLSRRPELCEQKQLVYEAIARLQRERFAPLVPSVLLGMSYGGMGGGLGSAIVNTGERWDADAIAYWELRNLGHGEHAARQEMASVAEQARWREVAVLDRIAREVMEAHAQVVQRQQRIELAKKGIVAAEKSYSLNSQRIENAQGLPIEVLQAVQALATARRAYLNAVIDYNIAQFQLCHATGWFADLDNCH